MMVTVLLNNVMCYDDTKLLKLHEKSKAFTEKFDLAHKELIKDSMEFFGALDTKVLNYIEYSEKKHIYNDIAKESIKAESVNKIYHEKIDELNRLVNEIKPEGLDDTKTSDNESKQQLQEDVRALGDQIRELKNMFNKCKTLEFRANAAETFKNKYEKLFKPDTIKIVEKLDQDAQKYNKALKEFFRDAEKTVIDMYEYVYNKSAVAAGISMPKTTKYIMFGVIGVVCVVVIAVIGVFAYKIYKEHNVIIIEGEEIDELQYS